MTITVGWNAAQKAGLTREEMDAWAYRSHQRAVAGIDAGSFDEEIFPIEVTKAGETFTFAVDEHPRRESTLEKLASLKPLHPEIEGFSITAGNAAGVNDGAAAMVVTDRAFAEEHGLEPLAVVRSWASVGVPPADTGLAPIQAIPKALERAGLSVGDVSPLRDQRGLRLGARRGLQGARPGRGDWSTSSAAAAASATRWP